MNNIYYFTHTSVGLINIGNSKPFNNYQFRQQKSFAMERSGGSCPNPR
jgi:hypothetical protein